MTRLLPCLIAILAWVVWSAPPVAVQESSSAQYTAGVTTAGAVRGTAAMWLDGTTMRATSAETPFPVTVEWTTANGDSLVNETADAHKVILTTASGSAVVPAPYQASSAPTDLVGDSATSIEVDAANTNRVGWAAVNNSTARVHCAFGEAATTTNRVFWLDQHDIYIMPSPVFTGAINCIWASDAGGDIAVTEFTQ